MHIWELILTMLFLYHVVNSSRQMFLYFLTEHVQAFIIFNITF